MNPTRDEAVVLHLRPYGDADAIVALFAREHGRISLFKRGMRTPGKRKAAPLMPATIVSLELWKKPGAELWNSRATDLVKQFAAFSQDILRLAAANVALEACRELIADGDSDAKIYALLCDTLSALAETSAVLAVLAHFDATLLAALGYAEQVPADSAFGHHTRRFEHLRGRPLPARAFLANLLK